MGDGMPYQLEKGPLLTIFEQYLNGDRATLEATLQTLRTSERDGTLDWIVAAPLWGDTGFPPPPDPRSGEEMRRRLLTEWFGLETDGAGGWRTPLSPPPTTGYWIGYRGDVERIVRRALLWALELALATGSDSSAGHPDPWPIELFWKCPAHWFEAWVVSRRVRTTAAGLVTVVLVTPPHRGADVAMSPIASSAVATPVGALHPVPSTQDDYELLTFRPSGSAVSAPHTGPETGRPRVAARQRNFATWVITHAQHVMLGDPVGGPPPLPADEARRERQENTAGSREFGDLEIPQLAEYEGTGDVVVVSPSMAAGGVKHTGRLT